MRHHTVMSSRPSARAHRQRTAVAGRLIASALRITSVTALLCVLLLWRDSLWTYRQVGRIDVLNDDPDKPLSPRSACANRHSADSGGGKLVVRWVTRYKPWPGARGRWAYVEDADAAYLRSLDLGSDFDQSFWGVGYASSPEIHCGNAAAPPDLTALLTPTMHHRLVLPYWIIATAVALPHAASLLASVAIRSVRRRHRRSSRCTRCAYDLTGNVSGVCPECGSPAKTTAA